MKLKRFRNINSITVIPETVFNDNREEIEKYKNYQQSKR